MRLIDADSLKITPLDISDIGFDVSFNVVLLEDIEAAPTIEAEPVRHGVWLDFNPDEYLDPRIKCSLCGNVEMLHKANYCPKCGAKMDGDGS